METAVIVCDLMIVILAIILIFKFIAIAEDISAIRKGVSRFLEMREKDESKARQERSSTKDYSAAGHFKNLN